MICPVCHKDSKHLKVIGDDLICHECGKFSESGGVRTDMILTRNSARIIDDQHQNEGSIIPPYVFSKSENKAIVNDDFIELYPDQAAVTYTDAELAGAGYPDLKSGVAANKLKEEAAEPPVEFSGDEQEAIKEVIKND